MIRGIKEYYREQGRQEMLRKCIEKFEELYDEYYSQGDYQATELTIDMVAYLQDDFEARDDKGV
jgi:hypothetical protein